jgi:enterochelin esterase-like enzyme
MKKKFPWKNLIAAGGFFLVYVQAYCQPAAFPPMGWNSYNCYGSAVHEDEVRANAEYMATKLRYGWQYIVVDFLWSYDNPPGSLIGNPFQRTLQDGSYVPWLSMDEWGRLLPNVNKFPSAAGGVGFKALADYIHGLGLKFGIHVMRGIPRQAVWAHSPVHGVPGVTADQIADTSSVCFWMNHMYGLDMRKRGAQEYLNSLLELYASWGVDFIKVDDIARPYSKPEIEGYRKAIEACGRPIVLSISPGETPLRDSAHVSANANMWRVADDFWDDWKQMLKMFDYAKSWEGRGGPGHWPDCDMIQIGKISKRGPVGPERFSRFTEDELVTHMSFWCIYRSPLMLGGNLPEGRELEEKLFSNEEVLRVNQEGSHPRQLYKKDGSMVWMSDAGDGQSKYVGLFNISDSAKEVDVDLAQLGWKGEVQVRDLWLRKGLGKFKRRWAQTVPAHGAILLMVGPGAMSGPAVVPPRLLPGDTAFFPLPPADFEANILGAAHGRLDSISYPSGTVGHPRKALVYTPPGYSREKKYPVLYLLHGIGGDEREWLKYSRPDLILDNLINSGKAVPMIVVFPNGRAMADDRAVGNIFDSVKVQAFANFENDLLRDLIPFIEARYPVSTGSANRALAGFSMGGGQSLNFGLGHPDVFGWVGGFSSAPNTRKPEQLVTDPAALVRQSRLIFISCGDKDGLIGISRGMHEWLSKNHVPHIYNIQPGAHNIEPWKRDLYNFSQRIFVGKSPNDTLQSVRIFADGRVLFSVYAPKAGEVTVSGDFLAGAPPARLTMADNGVWTYMSGPVSPDAYTYNFFVDGILTMDTRSPTFREDPNSLFNFFIVPGAETEFLAVKDVPHGRVEQLVYHSGALNTTRRMHVYLPPGFEKMNGRLPVLYLLHGGGDNDISWTSAGRVQFILDNLYAMAKLKPMIVVMPSGHAGTGRSSMGTGPDGDPFCQDFLEDIVPLVERTYPVSAKREDRAIAGFSMGGVQTLNLALWHPEFFGYVFPMSTGYFPAGLKEIDEKYVRVMQNPSLNQFRVFCIGRGKSDGLTAVNCKATLAMLEKYGIHHDYIEMDGAHSFVFSRRFIASFLPKLFW